MSTCCTYSVLPPLPTITQEIKPITPANTGIDKLLTVSETAKYLRVGTRTIYRAIGEGRLAAAWCGKSWLIREGNLTAFITRQEHEPSSRQKAKANAGSK
jgi:excisionase family DNA binding protein